MSAVGQPECALKQGMTQQLLTGKDSSGMTRGYGRAEHQLDAMDGKAAPVLGTPRRGLS